MRKKRALQTSEYHWQSKVGGWNRLKMSEVQMKNETKKKYAQ